MQEAEVKIAKSKADYEMAVWVRKKVFIEEQKVSESIELDEYENTSDHFLVLYKGKPAGASRIRIKECYVKFERIATLKPFRELGLGRHLMRFMETYSAENYPAYLPAMHAQKHAIGFYEKLGWVGIGEMFSEAEIDHRLMIYPPAETRVSELLIWTDPTAREDIKAYLNQVIIK
ncbi:MAG: GNAT family N-acetyltransferase [Bdellovibrionota bacterium]